MKRYTVYANGTMKVLETDNIRFAYTEYDALIELDVVNCKIVDNSTAEVITD